MPNSRYFSDIDQLINQMTVYPFYSSFWDEQMRREKKEQLINCEGPIAIKETTLLNIPVQEKSYIKYCPECIKQHGIYLLREHQILGNEICFEHQSFLKKILYEKHWDKLNFMEHIPELMQKEDFAVKKVEKEDFRYQLARMVHQIFRKGLKDEAKIITGKIRSRLKEMGYLDQSIRFCKLYEDLKLENYFFSQEEALEVILKICFDAKIRKFVLPLDYLFFVYQLFGSLDHLYAYNGCLEPLIYHKYSKSQIELEISTGKRYLSISQFMKKNNRKYGEIRKYCSEGKIEDALKVNCKWFVPEKVSIFSEKSQEEIVESEVEQSFKGNVLSVRQYAAKYKKSVGYTYVCCEEGRIEGAVKNGRKWEIPFDAPDCNSKKRQPFSKRVRNKEEMSKENFMTVKEYSEKYHLQERIIWMQCREGKIKGAVKLNGMWFIPKDAVCISEKKADKLYCEVTVVDEYMIKNCITIKEYAKKYGKSIVTIRVLCNKGRIKGAIKYNKTWFIPKDAPYPIGNIELSLSEETAKHNEVTTQYLTVDEYSNKHGKSKEYIRILCRENKIKGAKKIGKVWYIPEDAILPN